MYRGPIFIYIFWAMPITTRVRAWARGTMFNMTITVNTLPQARAYISPYAPILLQMYLY